MTVTTFRREPDLIDDMTACLVALCRYVWEQLGEDDSEDVSEEAAEGAVVRPVTAEELLSGMTVRQLRVEARAAGLRRAGGRRIAQATKAALLQALREV